MKQAHDFNVTTTAAAVPNPGRRFRIFAILAATLGDRPIRVRQSTGAPTGLARLCWTRAEPDARCGVGSNPEPYGLSGGSSEGRNERSERPVADGGRMTAYICRSVVEEGWSNSRMPPLKDIAGQTIADVRIMRRVGKNKHGQHLWEGKCKLCGSPVTKSLCEFRRFEREGSVNACGCERRRGLVGQTFGLITVTKRLPPVLLPSGKYAQRYEGLCECGTTVTRFHSNMQLSQACRKCIAKSRTLDLTNKIFFRLTVIRRNGSDDHGRAIWICRCSCRKKNPKHVPVTSRELLKGDTKSCGCWHDESASIRAIERLKTSVYAKWDCPFFRGRQKICNMRRSWEVMFGRYLDMKGWEWDYEPQWFKLPSGKRYLPDFRVRRQRGEVFFDVKGWKRPEAMQKILQFSRLHRICVIDEDELVRLTQFRPQDFKKMYDARHRWAYRGEGVPLWSSRLLPKGMC
jgi:hypothetical protein